MFISQLKNKLLDYDKFGIHRTDGLKVMFIFFIMIFVELFTNIKHPYFYYFFVPINCMNAELIGTDLKEKYFYLFVCLLGAIITIFFFNLFSIYKTFFILFVFFYTLAFYYFFIVKFEKMIPIVPLILGLGSYSLIYVNQSSNLYIAMNDALQTIAASGVMFAGLYLFSKRYYLIIWDRAFNDMMVNLEVLTAGICKGEVSAVGTFPGLTVMSRYSKMLPQNIKCYSILKITLLTHELLMSMSYLIVFEKQLQMEYVMILHAYITKLSRACKQHEPLAIPIKERPIFNATYQLKTLYQLILSWNYLCLK